MNMRTFSIELGAIMACYMLLMLPVVSATDVNILFNGELKETASISPENLVNRQVNIVHLPNDITWTNVKVLLSVSSASLAKSISRILVYKCKTDNPIDCIKSEPLEFEAYVDTELSWNDISEKTGPGMYPQSANVLMLVKLDGDSTAWTAFWDTIERTNYNVFTTKSSEIGTVDVELESLELLGPVKSFIMDNQMLPFTWLKSVTFSAKSLFGIGGNEDELDTNELQGVRPPSTAVTSISKDFFMMFPETANINHPVVLNRNPTYTCGNNIPELHLGETQVNCCYDNGCPKGSYCDLSDEGRPETGTCRSESSIALEIPSVPSVQVEDCTQQVQFDISARVLNAPASLPETASGRVTLKDTVYPVTCTKYTVDSYKCPLVIQSPAGCGYGDSGIGPNRLSLTLTYTDGPNQVSRDFERGFGTVTINYDCACPEGYYCDSSKLKCQPEGSITMGVISVRSFIDDYNEAGDTIDVQMKINNPPSDLEVTGAEYELGYMTFGGDNLTGMTGSITCEGGAETGHVYDCPIPFSISNYDHTKQYVMRDNSMTFDVSYSSGPDTKTKELTTGFSDVTIPSYRCGDGTCHPEEDSSNCCTDCGCETPGTYCDEEKGCQATEDIVLVVDSVTPDTVDGCKKQHQINMTAHIEGMPSDARIDHSSHRKEGAETGWPVTCSQPNQYTGIIQCSLTVPPQDGICQATSLPNQYVISPNDLSIKISYSDGSSMATKSLSASFSEIRINPVAVCGDGVCEDNLGEDASSCCLDCSCTDPTLFSPPQGSILDYYCDYDQSDPADTGECKYKNAIGLDVKSPTNTVMFTKCEIDNSLDVLVDIVNPPSRMRVDGWTATIGRVRETVDGGTAQASGSTADLLEADIPLFEAMADKRAAGEGLSPQELNVINRYLYQSPWNQYAGNLAGLSGDPASDETMLRDHAAYLRTQVDSLRLQEPDTGQATSPGVSMENTAVRCEEKSEGTYNCSIRIPAISDCRSGETYIFTGNTLSVSLSYPDGPIREIVSLTDDVVDAEVRQSTSTLFEIMEDSISRLQGKLDDIEDLMWENMKWMRKCMDWKIAAAIVNAALALIGAVMDIAGVGSGKLKGGWTQLGSTLGGAFMSTVNAICDVVTKYNEAMIEYQAAEIDQITGELCMNLYHHQVDEGLCRGKETQCMSQMAKCLSEMSSKMKSHFSNIDSLVGQMSNSLNTASKSWENVGQAAKQIGTGSDESSAFVILENSVISAVEGRNVCSHSGVTGSQLNPVCKNTVISYKAARCDSGGRAFVSYTTGTSSLEQPWTTDKRYVTDLTGSIPAGETRTVIFKVYCDDNKNNVFELDEDEYQEDLTKTITFEGSSGTGGNPACRCKGYAGTNTGWTTDGSTASSADDITTASSSSYQIYQGRIYTFQYAGTTWRMDATNLIITPPVALSLAFKKGDGNNIKTVVLTSDDTPSASVDLDGDGRDDIDVSLTDNYDGNRGYVYIEMIALSGGSALMGTVPVAEAKPVVEIDESLTDKKVVVDTESAGITFFVTDKDDATVSYEVDFGDGSTKEKGTLTLTYIAPDAGTKYAGKFVGSTVVEHIYSREEEFTVTVKATDEEDMEGTDTVKITASKTKRPTVEFLDATSKEVVWGGEATISFKVTDPDSESVYYYIEDGEGSGWDTVSAVTLSSDKHEATVTRKVRYGDKGTKTVKIMSSDDKGSGAEKTKGITVTAPPAPENLQYDSVSADKDNFKVKWSNVPEPAGFEYEYTVQDTGANSKIIVTPGETTTNAWIRDAAPGDHELTVCVTKVKGELPCIGDSATMTVKCEGAVGELTGCSKTA